MNERRENGAKRRWLRSEHEAIQTKTNNENENERKNGDEEKCVERRFSDWN